MRIRTGLGAMCLILAACASTTQYPGHPDAVSADTATVHFVRANSFYGSAITAPIYVDQYLIGYLGPGGHLTTRIPIGRVFVRSTTARSEIRAEKGVTYYFNVELDGQMWLHTPSFNVIPINRAKAQDISGRVL